MNKLMLLAGAGLIVLGSLGSADAQFRYRHGYYGGGWGPYYGYGYRRGGYGGALAAGLIGGVLLGGIAAAATAPAYAYPAYGYPYGGYPAYAYPAYSYAYGGYPVYSYGWGRPPAYLDCGNTANSGNFYCTNRHLFPR
jgi:hypothetical protein